ncbi:MAG: hypothetical protein HYZ29_16670 [Myxococcales bacterium]|nr:hypothetical protein [Myxococcales bacterium]
MRRAISLGLAVCVVAAGCHEDEALSDQEICTRVCEQYDSLGCKYTVDDLFNPVSEIVGAFWSGTCRQFCLKYSDDPKYKQPESECADRTADVMRCIETHGMACVEGHDELSPVVHGCDDVALRVAAPCRQCVVLPSGQAGGCDDEHPDRWHCPEVPLALPSYHPGCKSDCQPISNGEFCCAPELWGCDPKASDQCPGC